MYNILFQNVRLLHRHNATGTTFLRLKEPLCFHTQESFSLPMDMWSVAHERQKGTFKYLVVTDSADNNAKIYGWMVKPCHECKPPTWKEEGLHHVECRQSRLKHGQLHWMSTESWYVFISCDLYLSICGSVYYTFLQLRMILNILCRVLAFLCIKCMHFISTFSSCVYHRLMQYQSFFRHKIMYRTLR